MSERISFHDQIAGNKRKSIVLILIIFLFFIVLGYVISLALDPGFFFIIMILATLFSLTYILISYYNSDKIALASVKAKLASKTQHRDFYNAAESMSIASGMPMPKLYVMESEQINGFASGRDPKNAVICMTTGALKKLDKHELEGVIAHEMSHIANYDIRFMTLTAVLVGLISIIAQIYLRSLFFSSMSRGNRRDGRAGAVILIASIVAAILAPLFAHLVSLAISRKREFTADATAVKFTRNPNGLIGALEKIKKENTPEKKVSKAVAPLFFSNPFKGLSSTHPPLEKRIEVLKNL